MRKLTVTPEMVRIARQLVVEVKGRPVRDSRDRRNLVKLSRVRLASDSF